MSSRHPIQTSNQHKLYCVLARSKGNCCSVGNRPTRFVPLWSVQIESPISTLSPREKGKEEPFAMADATADLRKSIVGVALGYLARRLGCFRSRNPGAGQWPKKSRLKVRGNKIKGEVKISKWYENNKEKMKKRRRFDGGKKQAAARVRSEARGSPTFWSFPPVFLFFFLSLLFFFTSGRQLLHSSVLTQIPGKSYLLSSNTTTSPTYIHHLL